MELNEMKQKFVNLVNKYGKNEILHTFDYCSNRGIELANSTIDAIKIIANNNVVFVYNENEDDYDTIGAFEISDLWDFHDEIEKAILLSSGNYKDVLEVKELSYDEYWDEVKDYFGVGDRIIRVSGEDLWEDDDVVEFRNSCGCLLSKFNCDKNIALYY